MRGKELVKNLKIEGDRITPAYAGKSDLLQRQPDAAGDHPRVCGEKLPILTVGKGTAGSPPRMRGKGRVVPGKSLL